MKRIFRILLKLFFLTAIITIPMYIGNSIIQIKKSEIVELKKKKLKKPKKKYKITYISHDRFYSQIAKNESKGNYNIANGTNYIGKYQAGESALLAFGYSKEHVNNIKESVDTVYSNRGRRYCSFNVELFPPTEQERFIRWYMQRMENTYLRTVIKRYAGKENKGIHITKAGILYASMMGYGSVQSYFERKKGGSVAIKNRLKKYETIEFND
jgi:hypothetical protein